MRRWYPIEMNVPNARRISLVGLDGAELECGLTISDEFHRLGIFTGRLTSSGLTGALPAVADTMTHGKSEV